VNQNGRHHILLSIFHQTLTNFQNPFTGTLDRNFASQILPHLKRVATLPCKILASIGNSKTTDQACTRCQIFNRDRWGDAYTQPRNRPQIRLSSCQTEQIMINVQIIFLIYRSFFSARTFFEVFTEMPACWRSDRSNPPSLDSVSGNSRRAEWRNTCSIYFLDKGIFALGWLKNWQNDQPSAITKKKDVGAKQFIPARSRSVIWH